MLIVLLSVCVFAYIIYINANRSPYFTDALNYRKSFSFEKTYNTSIVKPVCPRFERIILLVLDGVCRDLLYDEGIAPVINARWKKSGLRFGKAHASLPTISAPNYFTLITGAPPFLHGVTNNARRQTLDRRIKTIFSYLEASGLSSACIGFNWYKTLTGSEPSLYIPVECCEQDDSPEVLQSLLRLIRARTLPFFTLAHFLAPDNAAHLTRSNKSHLYLESIRIIDRLTEELFNAIDRNYPNTLIIITADHGMNVDGNHGGKDEASLMIPLLLLAPHGSTAGRAFQGGISIEREIHNIDICTTIAAVSGIPLPLFCTGTILYELFGNEIPLQTVAESIDKKEYVLAALRGFGVKGYPVTENTVQSSLMHDRNLGMEIADHPTNFRIRTLRYQRIIASVLFLLFIIWVVTKSVKGVPSILAFNGIVLIVVGTVSGYIASRNIYDIAIALMIITLTIACFLYVRFLLEPSLVIHISAYGTVMNILAPMLAETVLISAYYFPFLTLVPDPQIFPFRFYYTAFTTPFIITGLIVLFTRIRQRSYLIAGNDAGNSRGTRSEV